MRIAAGWAAGLKGASQRRFGRSPSVVDEGTTSSRSLTALANLYGSDKGTAGPSRNWPAQNYMDVYEAYLSPLRNEAVTLLEIGLGVDGPNWRSLIQRGRNSTGGASLKVWRDYFVNGSIYGIDVNPAGHLDDSQIKTFVADQGSPSELQAFVQSCEPGAFDVIIDDGSHNPLHQQVSLSFFFRLLKPGGLYFIEDLATNGLGDIARGGMGSETVLNTRRVLRSLADTGKLAEPNAVDDAEYIEEHVEYIHLHAPRPRIRRRLRPMGRPTRRPVISVVSYVEGTERLCAIRKSPRSRVT